MAVLALILVLIGQMFSSISKSWKSNSGRTAAFVAARAAFESMSRNLSQATLATYLSYAASDGTPVPLINPSFKPSTGSIDRSKVPTRYLRMSELHFITGRSAALFAEANVSGLLSPGQTPGQAVFFQAPTGFVQKQDNRPKSSLLNILGYYIEFGNDDAFKPDAVMERTTKRYRYRLMEVAQAAEKNAIYESTCELDGQGLPTFHHDLAWIAKLNLTAPDAPKQPLAENIITMAMLPRLSPFQKNALGEPEKADALTKDFSYDSRVWELAGTSDERLRNQLPPLVELIVVSIDEPSAQKLAELYGGADRLSPPFENATVRASLDLDTLFKDPLQLGTDIKKVEDGLNALHVAYRIFRTGVAMHGAKWTDR
jgi:uncharacterized protein (TIGR02599 family)